MVSVTGSVLVYRNELLSAATPDPNSMWLVFKLMAGTLKGNALA